MHVLVSLGLIIAAIIHLLPAAGMAGPAMLQRLYGLETASPDLLIMMQHRALLFLLLGLFLLIAAFRPAWQPAAIIAGLISACGFVVFAKMIGDYSPAIARVVMFDLVAVAALLVSGLVLLFSR
jgi:hypothetical protein